MEPYGIPMFKGVAIGLRSPKKRPGGLATAGRGRRVWGEQGRVPWVPSKRCGELGLWIPGREQFPGTAWGKPRPHGILVLTFAHWPWSNL